MHESSFAQLLAQEIRKDVRRQAILDVLEIRFGGKAVEEFEPAVNRISNLDRLRELHRIAVRSRGVSQLRRAMSGD